MGFPLKSIWLAPWTEWAFEDSRDFKVLSLNSLDWLPVATLTPWELFIYELSFLLDYVAGRYYAPDSGVGEALLPLSFAETSSEYLGETYVVL